MLVLSRKVGETICIGPHVKVVVVRISGSSVRLGVEAPEEVPVWRSELGERPATADSIDGLPAEQ